MPPTDDFARRLQANLATRSEARTASNGQPNPPQSPEPVEWPAAEKDEAVESAPVPNQDVEPDRKPAPTAAPVGAGERVVRQGECVVSIANETGHFWETIWDDAANTELRGARRDPYVLLPGDRVHVPPLRQRTEPGVTETRHRFRKKNQPEVFKVRVRRDGQARGNEPYELDVDGRKKAGVTDAEGKVIEPIAPRARRARLVVGEGEQRQEFDFELGGLDPLDAVSGVQGRLSNLGFDCGPVDGKLGDLTRDALRDYQKKRGLKVTGEVDEATRKRLQEEHGC